MALSKFSLLTRFAKGAVDRQNERNSEKLKEAEARKQTMLAFAKESYKSDLNRYERLTKMQDTIFATGGDSLAGVVAGNYNVKAGKGKEELVANINKRLVDDPSYKEKLMNAYKRVSKPNPSDYFEGAKFDEIVKKRINSQDAITKFLFGSRQGPNMLTTEQLKDQEEDIISRGGRGVDFTGGLTEELSKLGLAGKPAEVKPNLGGKTVVETFIKHKLGKEEVPEWLQTAWDAKTEGKSGVHRVKSTITAADGSQEDFLNTVEVSKTGDIKVLDQKSLGQKKPEAPAPILTKEHRSSALRFLGSIAKDNETLETLLDSARGGDRDAMNTMNSFRTAVAERALTLREKSENRDKEFGDVLKMAYDEMESGLTMKDGAPQWLPEIAKGLFEEPAFEKPTGEVKVINTQEEFDALPSGATYKEADGKTYRKP